MYSTDYTLPNINKSLPKPRFTPAFSLGLLKFTRADPE